MKIQHPFFSVVISTKNRAELVNKAVQSIFKQTFQDFEVIVIDNASTDHTEEVLTSIQDHRFFYLRNEFDKERCFARNRGIQNATGTYICFLDSDDEFLPIHLQTLYDAIQKSNHKKALFFTNAYETYNFENLRERICPNLEDYELFEYILTYTFNPARVAIHHTILKECQFDEKIPGLEDLDLWLRIAAKYALFQIKERTILYHIHDESYSVSSSNRLERELFLYRYVFAKKELKSLLPRVSKRRLLSMCHYRIAMSLSNTFRPLIIHYHILSAFILYPKGYNKNSNKTMFVIFLYQLPILGFCLKKMLKIIR